NLRTVYLFFCFQAYDGIRFCHVTGVQTCALPIFDVLRSAGAPLGARQCVDLLVEVLLADLFAADRRNGALGHVIRARIVVAATENGRVSSRGEVKDRKSVV